MSMKEAYEQKLKSQLAEWKAEIDKLEANAKGAGADTQIEYDKKINELKSMYDSANEKLVELNKAGDDAWENLKAGIDSAWDSLGSAIKSAASKFK